MNAKSLVVLLLVSSMAIFTRAEDVAKPSDATPPTITYDDAKKQKSAPVAREESAEGVWRHPVALGLTVDETSLLVLCRRSASLVVVPLADPTTQETIDVGGMPEAMAPLPDGRWVIAESQRNELRIITIAGKSASATASIAVGDEPKQLVASSKDPIVWVSLRSGRAVEAVNIETGKIVYHQPLDFAPHCLALDADERTLFVADAYRGHLTAMEAASGKPIITRTFPGTNIRGLALSPDGSHLYFTHQIISERSIIERESVRWGAFITNNARRIARDRFFDPSLDIAAKSDLGFLGDFGNGAGDPGKLLLPRADLAMVCFSGTNEVGLDTGWPFRFRRIDVGRRPVDIVVNHAGDRAYIANMFNDNISIIDIAKGTVVGSISLGPLPVETAEMRGEMLFHDASLSLDSWYSCQSCHTDGQSNGSNSDTLSDGGFGAPKNTPSLLGVGHTKPWSWVGRFDAIEDQIESTLEHTMQSRRVVKSNIDDLTAYLMTLEPRPTTPSPEIIATVEQNGRQIFERVGCAECHAGERLTNVGVFNVELDDGRAGHREFNPPSLRRVAHTAPYFHDGRAESLEDVVDKYKHRLPQSLIAEDREALLTYLKSL